MVKINKILLCFVFLFLLSLVFAQDPWMEIFTSSTANIASLVGITLFAATIVMILIWMFANFINHEGIKASAKMELFEVFYSGVLFVFIFSLFPMFDNVIGNVVPILYTQDTRVAVTGLGQLDNSGYDLLPKHFRYPKYFLATLFNEAAKFNLDIYSSYAVTGFLGDIYISLDLFWEQRGFINYNPLKGIFHMGNVIKMQVFDLVVKVALLAKFQELFLHLFISALFPTSLAAGIILRSFKLTRKLGGLLMAIALSLYFVFPMSYIFAGAVYDHVGGIGTFKMDMEAAEGLMNPFAGAGIKTDEKTLDELNTEFGTDAKSVEAAIEGMSTSSICDFLEYDEDGSDEDIDKVQTSIGEWMNNFQENSIGIAAVDDGYFDIPARLIFFSMFFSFFGLMATIATIRGMSGIFGGDLEIAGLTHLI